MSRAICLVLVLIVATSIGGNNSSRCLLSSGWWQGQVGPGVVLFNGFIGLRVIWFVTVESASVRTFRDGAHGVVLENFVRQILEKGDFLKNNPHIIFNEHWMAFQFNGMAFPFTGRSHLMEWRSQLLGVPNHWAFPFTRLSRLLGVPIDWRRRRQAMAKWCWGRRKWRWVRAPKVQVRPRSRSAPLSSPPGSATWPWPGAATRPWERPVTGNAQ